MTLAGGTALVAALGLLVITRNRYLRGRLVFSIWLLAASLALQVASSQEVGEAHLLAALARLALVLALVNVAVSLLANPIRAGRPERAPGIIQDVSVIALFGVIATVLMREQLLTTSAVGAVVVGFALQDTLGNLFAGLAIQIEKPFRVGQWVQVGAHEGQVQSITWRATKVRTKSGQYLIVPNSVVAKEPVLNYSEPIVPTRLEVDVGASYLTPPNDVKRVVLGAIADASLALKEPAPLVTVHGFGASSVDYKALFWVEDYANDRLARDQVRTNIWYAFRRHNIEIPWPIQVEYSRTEEPARKEADVDLAAARLASIDLFATLDAAARRSLSNVAIHRLFAAGEAIVRQGAPGDSMFVMLDGRARVVLEPSNQPVALIERGGYFGEMSMLTGDARSATVRAIDDARVLEINAAAFRALAVEQPAILQHISQVVNARRSGLDEARHTAAASATAQAGEGLLERIQHFLGL